jgi:hypothetical protein
MNWSSEVVSHAAPLSVPTAEACLPRARLRPLELRALPQCRLHDDFYVYLLLIYLLILADVTIYLLKKERRNKKRRLRALLMLDSIMVSIALRLHP